MPSGIFLRSKIHGQHIGDSLRNKKKSETHVQHIKDAHKRSIKKYNESYRRHSIFMSKNNPMLGRKQSEKQKQKLAEYNKNRVFSLKEREAMRQRALKHPNRKFKETSIELKIEVELQKRGIIYQKQVPLCKIAIVDFYLPEYRAVIQCDGCYWHGCPIHQRSVIINLGERKKLDQNKDLMLIKNGLYVYRFWEHEINESAVKCINKLGL